VHHHECIAALRADGAAAAALARARPLATRVPSCPDWSLWELLPRLGSHHCWVVGNLGRTTEEGKYPPLVGRISPERIETFGDASLLRRWPEQARF